MMLDRLRRHFSFTGRSGRSDWWRAQVIYVLPFIVASPILQQRKTTGIAIAIILVPFVPLAWLAIATTVRRLHDRGRSGFFLFISLIPFAGPIWMFVECGFLPRHELSPPWNWPRANSATS